MLLKNIDKLVLFLLSHHQEHYCLRLSETVKNLQEQVKQQNKIISQLAKVTKILGAQLIIVLQIIDFEFSGR